MRIIYKTADGGVAVIIPAESVEAAMKDIPEGAESVPVAAPVNAEFAPLDIKASIPSEAVAAEAARAAIRTKYAEMQAAIDAAADTATLKTIVESL